MKTCSRCGSPLAADHRFCPRCAWPRDDDSGRGDAALAAKPAELSPDATTPMHRALTADRRIPVDVFTSQAGILHRALPVDEVFAFKQQLVIGRAPSADIVLPHPSVSRAHAVLERVPEGIQVRDLDSVNGVLVGGRRTWEPVRLRDQERIGIGPYLFCLARGVLHALDSSQ